ncbi:MAG: LysE family translocator [Rhodobacteraceae bacterium]|jgi:threonine/homoserine/homoserine lactone efflux protein|uniref:LysE family translocator n=1 Tax=uncultured Planktomarina sp. TaxID=1538529 RepID=UPI002A07F25C|nr:LysE family translocator [Paracoccaceae bacterium]MBT7343462.1 LysE family translocator [Paracoccaceae bacterium]
MTLAFSDLALYAIAVFILFITPGPVWVALLARAVSGGFHAAWPLAVGVAIGDAVWPILAILGVSWVVNEIAGIMIILRYVAAAVFLTMGAVLMLKADVALSGDKRLTRPGMWAGFIAGVLVILGNPKAILFYMGVLPGFFDLTEVGAWDVLAIVVVSILTPLLGNLAVAGFVNHARDLLQTPEAVRRINRISGGLLIAVGIVIPFA